MDKVIFEQKLTKKQEFPPHLEKYIPQAEKFIIDNKGIFDEKQCNNERPIRSNNQNLERTYSLQ